MNNRGRTNPKNKNKTETEKHQRALFEKSLRANGYVFPKTEDEMDELDKVIGSSDMTLPPSLQDDSFLFKKKTEDNTSARVVRIYTEPSTELQQMYAAQSSDQVFSPPARKARRDRKRKKQGKSKRK